MTDQLHESLAELRERLAPYPPDEHPAVIKKALHAAGAEARAVHRAQRKRQFQCFWAWPWGHVWALTGKPPFYCRACGRDAPDSWYSRR